MKTFTILILCSIIGYCISKYLLVLDGSDKF